jgi:hypothetical protein
LYKRKDRIQINVDEQRIKRQNNNNNNKQNNKKTSAVSRL